MLAAIPKLPLLVHVPSPRRVPVTVLIKLFPVPTLGMTMLPNMILIRDTNGRHL